MQIRAFEMGQNYASWSRNKSHHITLTHEMRSLQSSMAPLMQSWSWVERHYQNWMRLPCWCVMLCYVTDCDSAQILTELVCLWFGVCRVMSAVKSLKDFGPDSTTVTACPWCTLCWIIRSVYPKTENNVFFLFMFWFSQWNFAIFDSNLDYHSNTIFIQKVKY